MFACIGDAIEADASVVSPASDGIERTDVGWGD